MKRSIALQLSSVKNLVEFNNIVKETNIRVTKEKQKYGRIALVAYKSHFKKIVFLFDSNGEYLGYFERKIEMEILNDKSYLKT